jgi:hypothetical protein
MAMKTISMGMLEPGRERNMRWDWSSLFSANENKAALQTNQLSVGLTVNIMTKKPSRLELYRKLGFEAKPEGVGYLI